MYGLSVNYFAIDNDDAYIKSDKLDFSTSIYSITPTEVRAKTDAIPYSRLNIDTTRWVRKIDAFFIGFSITPEHPSTSVYTLSMQIEVQYSANYFELIFICSDLNTNNVIDRISYNYVEFYQDSITDYYQMQIIQDRNFATNPFSSG